MSTSVDPQLNEITELRHLLHRNAELSGREMKTMAILQAFIKENCPKAQLVEKEGWFYALIKGKGNHKIALRADMDGLPMPETLKLPYGSLNEGAAHKCGHDGHLAVLVGVMLECEKRQLENSVYFIFQPAEETGQGGKLCAELLREEGIEEVYAFHNLPGYPLNTLIYRRRLTQPASLGLTVRVAGKASHASEPESGNNPSGFLAQMIQSVNAMAQKEHQGIFLATVVNVALGARDFGISPGEGEISFTLRAENESELQKECENIQAYASSLAKEQGLSLQISESDRFPETRNDGQCLDKVLKAAEKAGISAQEMSELWRASEDFGHYLKQCPGAMFYLGCGEDHPKLHTPQYDFCDEIIPSAVQIFLNIIEG
ncbi:MAG: amidohydrolase [Erysipelotrichaceae bacterium]|nr:amidohydrolase [Erysipelotrichaceae bacterium]